MRFLPRRDFDFSTGSAAAAGAGFDRAFFFFAVFVVVVDCAETRLLRIGDGVLRMQGPPNKRTATGCIVTSGPLQVMIAKLAVPVNEKDILRARKRARSAIIMLQGPKRTSGEDKETMPDKGEAECAFKTL
jgi:hypothetical protein